jgi:hypothetical protein
MPCGFRPIGLKVPTDKAETKRECGNLPLWLENQPSAVMQGHLATLCHQRSSDPVCGLGRRETSIRLIADDVAGGVELDEAARDC